MPHDRILYTHLFLLLSPATGSIMTQSLCSLILFIAVISRPGFPDHPLTLRFWSSSFRETDCLCDHLPLLPNTLRNFHYILFCSESSTVTYIPSPSCAHWNLGHPWNPNFHMAFSGNSYLSPIPIGTEDVVYFLLLLIAASRPFPLPLHSQIWVLCYQPILPTTSLSGSHLPLPGDTSLAHLKIFKLLA